MSIFSKIPNCYLFIRITLTFVLPNATMDLFCGSCRARSACTYVQSDLALHSPPFFVIVSGKKPNQCYLTLSQTTNFGLFQTQTACRRQFHICSKWRRSLLTGRKHCGKRRNCSSRAISPFPTVFSKDLYCRHVKTRACLGMG